VTRDNHSRPPLNGQMSQPSPLTTAAGASRLLREHEPSPEQPLRGLVVPMQYAWRKLLAKEGEGLFAHYRHALEGSSDDNGTLGLIFAKV